MENTWVHKGIAFMIFCFVLGTSVIPLVYGVDPGTCSTAIPGGGQHVWSLAASEVWVDDDYYAGGDNDGHTWGYDAFDEIQDGIDHVTNFGTIHVKEGLYDVFVIEGRNALDILGEDEPIITGHQYAYDRSYAAFVSNVVFVNNSYNIDIDGVHIIGTDPTPSDRDFTVFFQNANGAVRNCTIDANSIENMNGIAVRAIRGSSVKISHCVIKDYGRIAVYAKTGTIINVSECTLLGQIYTQNTLVNYGIEIEGIDEPCLAIINGNDISHHDNTQAAAWSSAGIVVDYWRYYGLSYNCKNSTVQIEHNSIYDNMHGVQIVPNEHIELSYNELHENDYGAISEPWYDGVAYHSVELKATLNWWGDPTGPYHPTGNPDGKGDKLYGDVLFTPWITSIAANLSCEGALQWDHVAPGATVTGSFTLKNVGYAYSELSWEVAETPEWGTWTVTPENGTGLSPGMGPITVYVSVVAPVNKNKKFTGTLKIINAEDATDYCDVSITLKTPTHTPFPFNNGLLKWLFERFPYAFSLLRHYMRY